jgi:hypothetical protein
MLARLDALHEMELAFFALVARRQFLEIGEPTVGQRNCDQLCPFDPFSFVVGRRGPCRCRLRDRWPLATNWRFLPVWRV